MLRNQASPRTSSRPGTKSLGKVVLPEAEAALQLRADLVRADMEARVSHDLQNSLSAIIYVAVLN